VFVGVCGLGQSQGPQTSQKKRKKNGKERGYFMYHPSLTKQVWSRQHGENFFRQDAARNPEIFGLMSE